MASINSLYINRVESISKQVWISSQVRTSQIPQHHASKASSHEESSIRLGSAFPLIVIGIDPIIKVGQVYVHTCYRQLYSYVREPY